MVVQIIDVHGVAIFEPLFKSHLHLSGIDMKIINYPVNFNGYEIIPQCLRVIPAKACPGPRSGAGIRGRQGEGTPATPPLLDSGFRRNDEEVISAFDVHSPVCRLQTDMCDSRPGSGSGGMLSRE